VASNPTRSVPALAPVGSVRVADHDPVGARFIVCLVRSWLLLLLLLVPGILAATPDGGPLCGLVRDADEGALLPGVLVRWEDQQGGVLTDAQGRFCLPARQAGEHRLRVETMGFAPLERSVRIPAEGPVPEMELSLARRALELPGIQVLAEEGRGGGSSGSTSRIDRATIEHLQASSLADLFQLLPGQISTNPSLAGARQPLLRQLPTTAAAGRAAALGTALVVDGAPLSNAANLQTDLTILNAGPESPPPFSSTAGGAPDLRRISPDEIESLEVIRGVPSVRHGEVTAGAILLRTRIGAREPEVRTRLNPTLFDISGTAGWGDGVERSGWSATVVYTASQNDPRQPVEGYDRGTVNLAWRSPELAGGTLRNSLRLQAFRTLDERRRDPDDFRQQREQRALDRGVRATLSGEWEPERLNDRVRFTWTASGSVEDQEGSYQSLVNRSISPIATAFSDTTMVAEYGPSEYLNRTTVHGRPIHAYARVEGEARGGLGGWRHRLRAGLEFRHDENRGDGRRFDLATPPRQNYSVGDRPRAYSDVPALQIISAYLEDRLSGSLLGREVELEAGLRFDNVNPRGPFSGQFGTELQPRGNLQIIPAPDALPALALRAGAGRLAKAPPLAYLFPGPRYFDLVNLNYYHPDAAQRLLILTTRVVEPSNEGARSFTTRKVEGGLSWRGARSPAGHPLRGVDAHLTLFHERTRGAYGWDRALVSFPVERFQVLETPAGRPPVVAPDPARVDTFFTAYDVPAPTWAYDTRGLELTLDLPEWSAARTSLSLTGGWFRTRARNEAPTIDVWAFVGSSRPAERAGVYPSSGTRRERATTTLHLIHRVPEVGMVLTGSLQTVWWDRDRATGITPYPEGFVDRAARVTSLTPEEARSEAFRDLRRTLPETAGVEERRPPLPMLNLRLSKALPAGLELSFFLNNALSHRPLHERRRGTGFERRNPPLFFGAEVTGRVGGWR